MLLPVQSLLVTTKESKNYVKKSLDTKQEACIKNV